MKSIKPGRGPSMMNAAGAVFAAIFGVLWIIMTVKMGAPLVYRLFIILKTQQEKIDTRYLIL